MLLQNFFSYVEIKTKIASLLPFLLGLAYVTYSTESINWGLTGLFFLSMTLFDMATTALNNYVDTKDNGALLPFRRRNARLLLLLLLTLSTGTGIWLALLTGPVVLLAGAACFLVGILYTFGPAPISRMPLGEIFSGIFMGFFIPFLTVVINSPAQVMVGIAWAAPELTFTLHLTDLLRLLLLSIPPVMGIANIMLANNICDVTHDVAVNRYTLPYYLGRKRALALYMALYAVAIAAMVAVALTGVLPRLTLLSLFVVPLLVRNTRLFLQKQVKSETFPLSVVNFILLVLPTILLTLVSHFISR